jgi:hypothetical protein
MHDHPAVAVLGFNALDSRAANAVLTFKRMLD